MTRREQVRVGVLLTMLLLLFLASGYRADATVATIDSDHFCDEATGEWVVTWSVFNDDERPLIVTEQEPPLWPAEIPGKSTVTAQPVRLAGDALGTSAELIGVWSDVEPPAFLVGIVDLREETCLSVTTTTDPSTTTSSITGTTVPATTTTTSTVSTTSTTAGSTVPNVSTTTVPTPTRVDTGSQPARVDWSLIAVAATAGFAAVVLGVLAWRRG